MSVNDAVVCVGLSRIGVFLGGPFPNFMHLIKTQNMKHI
jgi:hypothetical protein